MAVPQGLSTLVRAVPAGSRRYQFPMDVLQGLIVATRWLGGVVGRFGLLGLDGDGDFNCGAFGAGADVELAAHVADAFAHSGDTYSGQLIARPKFRH